MVLYVLNAFIQINNMKEIFKPVIGYEQFYEVSNLGRVKSYHTRSGGNCLSPRERHRYNYTSLAVLLHDKQGGRKETQISRLVAQAFIPNLENKPMVNHLDNDAKNNIVTNLEWCTYRENIDYAVKQNRMGKKTVEEMLAN